MKPLASGDFISEGICIQKRVDTIEHNGVTVYKYIVVNDFCGTKIYHLSWQMFIGDEKVRENLNCYKFLTKSDFKTLCTLVLTEYFKESLNIK